MTVIPVPYSCLTGGRLEYVIKSEIELCIG